MSRIGDAGEAAGGAAAVVLLVQGTWRRFTGRMRADTCREVQALRAELVPALGALTGEMNLQRRWRRHVEGELGYLRGAVEVLLDGKAPTPARRRSTQRKPPA